MSYEGFIKSIENSLDKIVGHVEYHRDLIKYTKPETKLYHIITPELYMAQGLREAVMLLVDPVGRMNMHINHYRNRNQKK